MRVEQVGEMAVEEMEVEMDEIEMEVGVEVAAQVNGYKCPMIGIVE